MIPRMERFRSRDHKPKESDREKVDREMEVAIGNPALDRRCCSLLFQQYGSALMKQSTFGSILDPSQIHRSS